MISMLRWKSKDINLLKNIRIYFKSLHLFLKEWIQNSALPHVATESSFIYHYVNMTFHLDQISFCLVSLKKFFSGLSKFNFILVDTCNERNFKNNKQIYFSTLGKGFFKKPVNKALEIGWRKNSQPHELSLSL